MTALSVRGSTIACERSARSSRATSAPGSFSNCGSRSCIACSYCIKRTRRPKGSRTEQVLGSRVLAQILDGEMQAGLHGSERHLQRHRDLRERKVVDEAQREHLAAL